jgi:two-component system CheB/CheR fusion protein
MDARNDALHATNTAMGTRNADLEATVAAVEHANGELRTQRVAVQELAAVLEAERAQLTAILDDVTEAVLVVDRAGTPVRMNAAYARLLGDAAALVPDDARGVPLPPDQTPQARAARGETFSLSCSLPTGVPSLRGEDTRRWFVATGQPLPEGGVTHGLVVIRDVTLSDRHRSLQDEFLALAAHELRTPLTSVQGYLDLLAPLLTAGGEARASTRRGRCTRRGDWWRWCAT